MVVTPSKYFGPSGETYDVIILTGSDSDQETLDKSGMFDVLRKVGVTYHQSQLSAHRHDDALWELCLEAINDRGAKIFIGVAGMAAALPGAIAAVTKHSVPVIGVALDSGFEGGLDALLSMTRMPKGVPVLCTGIGSSGLVNAAIAACQILSLLNEEITMQFFNYRAFSGKEPAFGVRSSYQTQAE